MHVAGPVANPKHLPCDRLVRRDWVIAWHRAPMWIGTPASTLGTRSCRYRRAVHVQRKARQSAVFNHLGHKVLVDFKQPLNGAGIESVHPAPQGVPTWQPGEPAQQLHQGIDHQVTHVPHPPGARYQLANTSIDSGDGANISPPQGPFSAPQGAAQIQPSKKSPDQFPSPPMTQSLQPRSATSIDHWFDASNLLSLVSRDVAPSNWHCLSVRTQQYQQYAHLAPTFQRLGPEISATPGPSVTYIIRYPPLTAQPGREPVKICG